MLVSRRFCTVLTAAVICSHAHAADDAHSAPKRATLVIVPSPYDSFLVPTGNVKVTFRDGHTELWTHEGDCRDVKTSSKGNVGWVRMDKKSVNTVRMTIAGKDTLVVRLRDGTTHEFPPFEENVSIEDWRFADDDTAIIMRSMGHHGPSSYVKYAVSTGRVIDSRAGYIPNQQLPSWAKPIANPLVD
jgi:hypothetical protein